ncbi:MAG TPA: hypothetical protein VJO52_03765 [Gemmatimonadaceae bacterium]|nr:hypothetical protein [Gemmatimonadaceae bacterium]
MTISLPRIIALLAALVVTAMTAGPGLPADFPLAPGLSACHPTVMGPEVICEWKGVDGHAVYTFYHEALPKAGYTLLAGAGEQSSPREMGALGFKKGSVSGALTVRGTTVTIQVITCPTAQSCQ